MGYLVLVEGYNPISKEFIRSPIERDTWNCSHCSALIIKNPLRVRDRAFCYKCMSIICDWCSGFDCRPIKKLIEETIKNEVDLDGFV